MLVYVLAQMGLNVYAHNYYGAAFGLLSIYPHVVLIVEISKGRHHGRRILLRSRKAILLLYLRATLAETPAHQWCIIIGRKKQSWNCCGTGILGSGRL
jgi:hypothetical protein